MCKLCTSTEFEIKFLEKLTVGMETWRYGGMEARSEPNLSSTPA